jgi:hypothetical protein
MNTALHKKLITESIRGWFVLDNILFNGDPSKCLSENVLNKYLSIKKKYLKTVFEFYVKTGYKSSFNVLPKTSEEIEKSARIITESLKKDLSREFTRNRKEYCKLIAEGVDYNNDKLLKQRTNYLGRSLMIENYFINRPIKSRLGTNLIKQEIDIYKNCLKECMNVMLKIACKYNKNF